MSIINRSMFPLSTGIGHITTMKARFDKLQVQLATGEKAATLAEMGTDRYFDLSLRQRIARIDSFKENIKTIELRLSVLDDVVSRLDTIESDARAATMAGSGGKEALNLETAPTLAASRLDEVLTLLNSDIAGRHLFGGSKTETKPIASPLDILSGSGTRAGLSQVVDQRRQADLGTAQMGRLGVTTAADTVTLARDGNHPFGMQLGLASTTSANITVSGPAGAPPQLGVQFGATLPVPGEMVTIGLTMPDGTQSSVTLTASAAGGVPGSFVVGPDADATAAAFGAALTAALEEKAKGEMTTASTYAASDNFFFGQGEQPMRVDGPPYDTATALVAGTPADTVMWYNGADSANPRHSVTARVGEGTTVAYGVQANEGGIVKLVRALGAMAVQSYPPADETSAARYTATVSRNTARLAETAESASGSIEVIAVELGLAQSTAGTIKERHTAHRAQLDNMLKDIENAPVEQVAMELLALKTRLEASYSTVSMLSQLSLVNYLK